MDKADAEGFKDVMNATAELYGKELSKELLRLYWFSLAQYEFSEVKAALARHIQNPDNGQFMPKVADIVRMLSGTSSDLALAAWSKVERAVRMVGCDTSVIFDDAIIHRVITDMGGWSSFRSIKEADMPFKAKEFENRYRAIKSKNAPFDYLPVMVGLYEAHNSAHNLPVEPPVMVGDAQQCLLVNRLGKSEAKMTFARLPDVSGVSGKVKNTSGVES